MNKKAHIYCFICLLFIGNSCVTLEQSSDDISITCDTLKKKKVSQYIAISYKFKNQTNKDALVTVSEIRFPNYKDKITILLPQELDKQNFEATRLNSASSLSFATIPFATRTGQSSGSTAIAALFTLVTVAAAYHAQELEKESTFTYEKSFLIQDIPIKSQQALKKLVFVQLENKEAIPNSIAIKMKSPKA
ncbi:MAG: hypothetical protein HRU09_20155 [Oligoflexales bacterium]|nr:hypothetical protein [Oligoflexales bacterium]